MGLSKMGAPEIGFYANFLTAQTKSGICFIGPLGTPLFRPLARKNPLGIQQMALGKSPPNFAAWGESSMNAVFFMGNQWCL